MTGPTPIIEVVLVEDHEGFRDGLQALLNTSGRVQCRAHADPQSALQAIEERLPDAVIMDINLGGTVDGIQATRLIKQRWPAIQVMICTVHEDDEKIFSALRAGATGYLLKRSSLEDMIDALDQLLAGGSPMSLGIARRVVSSFTPPREAVTEEQQLTVREREVLDLLATGRRVKEIAAMLFVSPNTVRTHIRHIYEKLQVQGRMEAVNKARSWGA